ncbi:MAG TPA: alpha/beta hydrolase [Stellaceae bacterium]|nr:alpha/beta hydrolase [Stellaceae bacterium]
MAAVTEAIINAAGIAVELRRGGAGAPLLFLHGELGCPGWLDAFDRLAQSFDVIVPSLPGYGRSERPDWIMGTRDLATWVTWLTRDLGINTPVNLVGCSLGGWVAAEIATIAPRFMSKLVLADAMGLKPDTGEIFDYFLESGPTGLKRAFLKPEQAPEYQRFWGKPPTPEDLDLIEQHREMTCRVAWKPYMHSLTLPHLLAGVTVETLILWGRQDAIAPLACGELYRRALKRSRLEIIDECGHLPEMERPAAFAARVSEFLRG